jgi:hypothetical protein
MLVSLQMRRMNSDDAGVDVFPGYQYRFSFRIRR